MVKNVTLKKYSFWKENRIQLLLILLCGVASLYSFTTGSYGLASLNAFVVVLNVVFIYKNLPPKWARQEMKEIKLPSNEEFINHLSEDLHSEVGIRIYDEK